MRPVTRVVSAAGLAAGLVVGLLGIGGAAHATQPIPSFVEYTGTGQTVSSLGGNSGDIPFSVRIDCATGVCVLGATMTSNAYTWDMTQGTQLVLENGHGEFAMGEWGDICGAVFWTPPGPMIVDATADGITITRNASGSPTAACLGPGSGAISVSFVVTANGTVSGGDPCVLDSSCPVAAPIVAPAGQSGLAEPGTLSTLPTVADTTRPANILWAVGLTIVLVLLVAFPAHLLNTAAESGTDRFTGWWARIRPKKRSLPAWIERFNGWPLAIAGVLAASLISAFVDPHFGLDPGGSVRIFGSVLLAFVLDVAVGWFVLLLFLRRTTPDAKPRLRFAPASLLLVLAAVVFSRITGFQPGIVFGLVAGVVIGAALATAAKARVALLGVGYSFAVGVVAWIAYTAVSATAGSNPPFGVVFAQETLAATAIGGLAVLPVALFPVRGMSGFDVFRWNRVVWLIAYSVGLVAFFFVLMPMPFAWQGVPLQLGVWIGLYLLYALGAVGIWAAVTQPWKREKATETA